MSFERIENVAAASELAGGDLCVPAEESVPPPADFYYSHEVEGWQCLDTAGNVLGIARGLEETAAGPLLSIETPAQKEALAPFVHGIVVAIDRRSRRIVLDPPEGLLDL